ncbi:hypothetical protein [Membranihabitans maritimus]|uniref:hypothetical protein n=1 Tax=Membranihabitans maritimus TaxID=2904244 RepID=UPI001F1F044C|nr:hypothetical protein [Membranihabitans maritimus]
MKPNTFNLTVLILLSFLSLSTAQKKSISETWYKGNLHAHSFWSDGNDFPEMIMDWYKNHNYDFAVLSDHNTLNAGEKWVTIDDNKTKKLALQKYQKKFEDHWIHTRKDSEGNTMVRLKTLQEYRSIFEASEEFLIIQSEEITDRYENKHIHVNATNIVNKIEPRGGKTVAEMLQNNIDAVNAQRKETGVPMIPHINHPNFGWSVTTDDIKKLDGEQFFEVYNGHPAVHNFGDDTRPGMDEMWDDILTAYILNNKPPLYGLATDDSHSYHERKVGHSNTGRGWVMVNAQNLNPVSIINALEKGDFYATSGVNFNYIKKANNTLSFEVQPETGVTYKVQFIGTKKSNPMDTGIVLKETNEIENSYTLTDDDLYVRAIIISDKLKENPYQEGETERAWVQPLINK